MKYPDWATRLDAYIAAAANMPFSYDPALGFDCCRFTFGAIHAQTGVDVGEQFRDKYRSKREALMAMKKYCGKPSLCMSIHKLMSEYDFDRVGPFHAQRGDALLVPNGPSGDFFGILSLDGKNVLGVGDHGVRRIPLSILCRAWRVA